ncbi:MAG: DNA polymerase Y family protein [Gemmatimonadaceae bacterium]|nr:DNA polymerase Y family protein [Chitinophagaceae bacterium]
MQKRFVSICFRFLETDWFTVRRPNLKNKPLVIAAPEHGRMVITAANSRAQQEGIENGMVLADARALYPLLEVCEQKPGLTSALLKKLAQFCIRFTPSAAIDLPDGLLLDATGCAHLWGGEEKYLEEISKRFSAMGYQSRVAMSDTIGTSWGIARYAQSGFLVAPGKHHEAILSLPPEALRPENETAQRLHKLGLRKISQFIHMPRTALRRRFGQIFLQKIDQCLGFEDEIIIPVDPVADYQERLPCLEPISTHTGIEIAMDTLLSTMCTRLAKEELGIRQLAFICHRVDNKVQEISISTGHPSNNKKHLFRLLETKINEIEPALGIEIFILEASIVEKTQQQQEKIWEQACGLENNQLNELIDRMAIRVGTGHIYRYVPDEHYWPERSLRQTASLQEKSSAEWSIQNPRPIRLLLNPESIEVTAPIPDYPPMLFRYKGRLHKIIRADGPERIEQEWWIEEGRHRDYYQVEDENGDRYWLFRSGHYDLQNTYKWFIHGFFA